METLRQYARQRLDQRGQTQTVRARHANFYLRLAEQAARELQGPAQRYWLEQLEAEHDELREALAWSVEWGEAVDGLRLGVAPWRFWSMRGRLTEGRRWLDVLLARAEGVAGPLGLQATSLHASGQLAFAQGDWETAAGAFERSLRVCRTAGDRPGVAAALRGLGNVAQARGDYIAGLLQDLAILAWTTGAAQQAAQLSHDSLALFVRLGDRRGPGQLGLAATAGRPRLRDTRLAGHGGIRAVWESGCRLPLEHVLADALRPLG